MQSPGQLLTQACLVARKAARQIRADAIEDGHPEPAEIAWDFWRDDEDAINLELFTERERAAVREAFLDSYGNEA